MRKSINSVLIAVLSLGLNLGTLAAENKGANDQLETHARRVNKQADKPGMMNVALERISTETGVPLDRVQAMHKDHAEAGAAGILMANVMADETKKSPEDFLKKHLSGKSWAEIARDNKVPADKLDVRLNHLESALTSGTENPSKANKDKRQKG